MGAAWAFPRDWAALLSYLVLIDALIGSTPGSRQPLGQAVPRVVLWGGTSGSSGHRLCTRPSPRTLHPHTDLCLRLCGGSNDAGTPPREEADELLKGWYEERMRMLGDAGTGAGVDATPSCSPGAEPQEVATSGSGSLPARGKADVRITGEAGADADANALVGYADALSRASWNNTAAAQKALNRALALRPTLASALALSARLQQQSAAGAAAAEELVLATHPHRPSASHDAARSAALLDNLTATATGMEALVFGAETRMRAGDAAGAEQLAVQAWESQERRATLETTQWQIDGFFSQPPHKCHQHRVASVRDGLKICLWVASRVEAHAEVKRRREELKEAASARDTLQRELSFLRYLAAPP